MQEVAQRSRSRTVIEARQAHGGACTLIVTCDDRGRVQVHFYGENRSTAVLNSDAAQEFADALRQASEA